MTGTVTEILETPIPQSPLRTFDRPLNIAVIGASGGIGAALTSELLYHVPDTNVAVFSRQCKMDLPDTVVSMEIDLEDERLIASAAQHANRQLGPLGAVFVTTGMLHAGNAVKPEKSWRALEARTLEKVFRVNTIGPALVAKHFLPLMKRDSKSVFACLSARVGSIEDNRLGGWYAYRASKAALNMMIKTLSIELSRSSPHALCVGLHPGTVDTNLSKPFQGNVRPEALFTPVKAARALLSVVDDLTIADTGKIFAWDGTVIPY